MTKFEEIFFTVLYVVVALFAHKKLTYEFSVPKYAILSLGFSILLTIAIIRLLKKKGTLKFNFAHLLFFGFAVSALLSTINVFRDRPFYLVYSIDIALYTLLNAFLAVYISNYYKEKDKITRFLFVVILTAGFISYDALLNFYAGFDLLLGKIGTPFTRASIKASIGNTIFVANYLGMVIPTTLYFILSYNFGWKNIKNYTKVLLIKSLATLSLILMLITVIVSQTRSEYGGVFLTNLFFFIFYFIYVKRKEKKDVARQELEKTSPELAKKLSSVQKLLIIIAAIATAFIIVLYNLPTPLTGHGKFTAAKRVEAMLSTSSWDERMLAWFSSYEQWKDHKIFGTGIGTYQILTISYMGDIIKKHPRFIWGWNNFKRTHNDYFQVLGETGIVGTFFMIVLLLYLVIYFFRTLRRLDDKDDALLFLALSMGFADFAIQSFFSFPGHLLPNALTAMFLASTAVSGYFNKDEWLTLKLKVDASKKAAVFLLAAALILTYTSTYMRWRYFISEVHFKSGNSYYLALMRFRKYQNDLKNQLPMLEKDLEDLQKKTGKYSYLKDLESYKAAKAKELGGKIFTMSNVELERARLEEIKKLYEVIKKKMDQAKELMKKIEIDSAKYYAEALKELSTCLKINHAYGKAYFYMAALAVQPERLVSLRNTVKTIDDYRRLAEQEFDIFQKFIHPLKKREDLLPIVKLMEKEGQAKIENSLGKGNLLLFQQLLDAVSLYETSLLVFNERNTYKALAGRFASLDNLSKLLRSRLPDSPNAKPVKEELEKASQRYYDNFREYAMITIHNLPGSWNRFPDWKNYDLRKAVNGQDIYRYFAEIAVKIKPIDSKENKEFLHWLANKEIWATEMMSKRGVWGVPDALIDFLHSMANIMAYKKQLKDSIEEYEKMLSMYSESYKRIEKELPMWRRRAENDIERMAKGLSEKDFRGEQETSVLAYLEKALREFSNEKMWISLQVREIKEFLKGNMRAKYNPWESLRREIAKLLIERLGGDYREIYSQLSPTFSLLVYERYIRFKAHYKLLLNDSNALYENVKKLLNEDPETTLKNLGVSSPSEAEKLLENFHKTIEEYEKITSTP